ncbi:hypothetical protein [Chroococcidiopsis sp. CCNUC1]|jgi:hypothetical protein|uniref:hypothetical protein n=1 Tax=Chroococcidiopsis sp. CCNUC1 TaxID=2653189 RepID=UPI000D050134|nr:hypothetical protein [Chroococcidiopsis sp. CCNUC1]PSB49354.1 hypothetical protein C7B80_02590 [Cyanosarcina cf. burmensis CCALA 770]URD51629.1 hypothetical protein M5J74_06465 [Chroococcidiopsis sp. CCNUC1]
MRGILSNLKQGLLQKLLLLFLVSLLGFFSTAIAGYSPVYAATLEETQLIPPEYKPTPEEKIERAYEYSEATGLMEEAKQARTNSNRNFDPNLKANIKNIDAQAQEGKTSLKDKAKGLLEKIAK